MRMPQITNLRIDANDTNNRATLIRMPYSLRVLNCYSHTGFTLVELMVSITIFILVSGIVMVSQSSFRGNILLANLAYDVALSVRQAQTYGVGVKQNISGTFDRSYGIHFGNRGYYILFSDNNNNGNYDLGNGDSGCFPGYECLNFWKLQRGNYIQRICAGASCSDSPAGSNIDGIDIVFTRPDPEPKITGFRNGSPAATAETATITVASPQGATRSVVVRSSGQISVQ